MKTMTKLQKHSTADLARCKGCGGEFSALWGKTVVHALSGMGLCDGCKKEAEGAKSVTKPLTKRRKGKDDGVQAGKVQETGS